MTDFQRAIFDPKSVYQHPRDVATDDTLSREQKIKILLQWKQDAINMQVAEGENMPGDGSPTMLNRIMQALDELDPDQCHHSSDQ